MSCNILLTREAVKPPQTDQKYLAAVPDLGNIAELSAPVGAKCVARQAGEQSFRPAFASNRHAHRIHTRSPIPWQPLQRDE
jgi:hypothetical protein